MCTFYERVIELSAKRGVSGSRVCLDLGLSKSTLSDIKSGRKKGVSAETAQKFADYFGVTVGYLLGKEETKKAPTENGERDVLDEVDIGFYNGYKELDEADKEVLRDMVQLMRQRRANQDNK